MGFLGANVAKCCLAALFQFSFSGPVVLDLTRRPGIGQREERRLTGVDEARLFGDLTTYASYHVDVLVGTPGQMQSVIVDTGSSMTAFPCESCGSDCGTHIDPPFAPSQSSTFTWVSCDDPRCQSCSGNECRYIVRYLEGSSISGRFFEDVVRLGNAARGNSGSRLWLGCHTKETNLFRSQAPSGIMGLDDRGWDVVEALVAGHLDEQIIGLCLSSTGGVMVVGGINETWTPLSSPLQWVPYSSRYHVALQDVDIVPGGKQTLALSVGISGSFHLDSGTTYTYFDWSQELSLQLAIAQACADGACGSASKVSSRCWRADEAAIDQFPELHFQLKEAVYVWTARGYLESKPEDGNTWCYTFYGDPPLTLGASFMRHHLVLFHRGLENIGFAQSPCPSYSARDDPIHLPTDRGAPDRSNQSWSTYGRFENGAAECPPGLGISSYAECKSAAHVLGIAVDTALVSSYSDIPKGCSVQAQASDSSPERLHFNAAAAGHAANDYALLCRQDTSAVSTVLPTVPPTVLTTAVPAILPTALPLGMATAIPTLAPTLDPSLAVSGNTSEASTTSPPTPTTSSAPVTEAGEADSTISVRASALALGVCFCVVLPFA